MSTASVSFSIPTNSIAIFLKRDLTLCPAFAEVSMNMMSSCAAFALASSRVTCLVDQPINMEDGDNEWAMPVYRLSDRSALLPTKTMMTSFPRSDRTSSIHLEVDMNDCRSVHKGEHIHVSWGAGALLVISNTTIATEQSRMYEGISERYRSFGPLYQHANMRGSKLFTCPAVSHSCNRTVRSSRYMALLRKSIPMVAW